MAGICCGFTIFPIHSQQKKPNQPPNSLLPRKNIVTISPYLPRTNSLASNLHLALTEATQPKPRDLSVLLQNGALLLFVYWIGNFVAPNLISKMYTDEKTEEDKKDEEENTSTQAESTIPRSTAFNSRSPGRKKKK